MFKRVIIPTFFSLILKFVLAACVFWVFNGWWEAYITGDGNANSKAPEIIKKETIVEIKLPRERVMLDDEIPWLKKNNKYSADYFCF